MKSIRYIAAIVATLCSGSLIAAEISPKLRQNLEIMQDILEKSLQQGRDSSIGRIEHSYLAGQGVLFQTSTKGGFQHFFAMAPMAPLPPVPPLPPISTGNDASIAAIAANAVKMAEQFDHHDYEDFAEKAEAAAEAMMDQQDQLKSQMRDLREQKRDIDRDLRDVEREKRDLEFSKKVGKLDAEQQKQLAQLDTRRAELQKQANDMQQKYNSWEQNFQKQQAEQAKIALQKQNELIGKVGINFASTLCDYGASLRELKDSEFISLQLSTRHGRDNQDIYWVFKKSDVNQCVGGKLNAAALLKKADYYQY